MGESGIAQANRLVGQYRGATLALRQHKGMEEVHAYRIAARRLLALLALWRPLIHEPELERRLTRAVGTLSALRDAQVYAQHHGGSLRQNRLPRVPLLTGPLAGPTGRGTRRCRSLAAVSAASGAVTVGCTGEDHLPSYGHQGETSVLAPAASGAETGALRDGAADGTGGRGSGLVVHAGELAGAAWAIAGQAPMAQTPGGRNGARPATASPENRDPLPTTATGLPSG